MRLCLAGSLTALAAYSTGAHAQAVNQYLNSNVSSYGLEPGVTVTSRLHSDYDPIGIRVGIITLLPSLDEGVGYDDNVTGTSNARGSVRIDTDAKLVATANPRGSNITATLNVADTEFTSQSSQSFTNWTADVSGTHDFGEDQLYLGATHYNLNQTPRDLGEPQLDSAIGYHIDEFRANYTIALSRLRITPGLDVSLYNFDNGSVAGVPYLQSYRNRAVYQPTLTANYELAPRRTLVVILRDADAVYDNTTAGLPQQNFNDFSILGGAAYDVDGIIDVRLLAGYEERSFSSNTYKMIQAPIVEGAVTWTPTGLTTVSATAARYITDATAEATVAKTETALKFSVDHELFRNIILNANARFIEDDYADNGGSQQFYAVGGGVTWRLNRYVRLVADYNFYSRQSQYGTSVVTNVPVAPIQSANQVVGSNYTENVFRLRLKLAF